MPIDPTTEQLITFADLAASLPRRRQGRPVHVSTVHRWRYPGHRGVRLEAIRVGGSWVTTREAFARFCRALTAAATGKAPAPTTTPMAQRRHDATAADLAAGGW